jgi:hypothetical protein
VRLEGLGKLKKSNDLIGNRIRDLPACNMVPQTTALLRAPGVGITEYFHISEWRVQLKPKGMRNGLTLIGGERRD